MRRPMIPVEGANRLLCAPIANAKMVECTWLNPVLVARFEFLEWTADNHLRHSRFVALREDKQARSGAAEREKHEILRRRIARGAQRRQSTRHSGPAAPLATQSRRRETRRTSCRPSCGPPSNRSA